jgi:hypothetical protein
MNRRTFLSVRSAGAAWAGTRIASADVPGPCAHLPQLAAPPVVAITHKLFPGFTAHTIRTSGATINVLKGGDGPPLLAKSLIRISHLIGERFAVLKVPAETIALDAAQ